MSARCQITGRTVGFLVRLLALHAAVSRRRYRPSSSSCFQFTYRRRTAVSLRVSVPAKSRSSTATGIEASAARGRDPPSRRTRAPRAHAPNGGDPMSVSTDGAQRDSSNCRRVRPQGPVIRIVVTYVTARTGITILRSADSPRVQDQPHHQGLGRAGVHARELASDTVGDSRIAKRSHVARRRLAGPHRTDGFMPAPSLCAVHATGANTFSPRWSPAPSLRDDLSRRRAASSFSDSMTKKWSARHGTRYSRSAPEGGDTHRPKATVAGCAGAGRRCSRNDATIRPRSISLRCGM